MAKYCVIIRPFSDCNGIYEVDGYGHAERLDGTFCICGEHFNIYAESHADGRAASFKGYHLDELEENEVTVDMEFPDDEAALRFVDWFDGCGFDPWLVDFIFAYDGQERADREVYAM